MANLLERELEAGALGLSTGLEYDPGIYSTTEEVVTLARAAAAAGGRYISHLRSEDRRFWLAVEEILEIGRRAGLPVQISHVKLAMTSLHGRAGELIARLEEARAEGIEVTAAGAHPRGFGSFPRVLGRYVRERGALTLEDAIHKMTGATATRLGIRERGTIAPGRFADLVLFDPERIADRATTDEPHAVSEGIDRVWVNGQVVYEAGRASGRRPGRVLRRDDLEEWVKRTERFNWRPPTPNRPKVTREHLCRVFRRLQVTREHLC